MAGNRGLRIPRGDALAIALVLLASALIWAPRSRGPIDLRYDAGVYYVLGTSLAEGRGYRLLNEPGDPRAIQYPPLLPAFVAAHQVALGGSDPARVGPWLRASFCLLTTSYLLATYAMARPFLTAGRSLLVASIAAFHLQTTILSNLLFAEIPFALLAVLFVVARRWGGTARGFALQAALGAAAFLVRTAGIALLAAWVAEALLDRRWARATARAAVALIPVIAWQAYIARVRGDDDYRRPAYAYQRAPYQYYNVSYGENIRLVDPFVPELGPASAGDLGRRALANLAAMPAALGEAVTSSRGLLEALVENSQRRLGVDLMSRRSAPIGVALVAIAGLAAAGVGLLGARREWLIPAYLLASMALICTTPWPGQMLRYVTPLAPFLGLGLVLALGAFEARALRRWPGKPRLAGTALAAPVMMLVLGSEFYSLFAGYRQRQDSGRDLAALGRGGGEGGRLLFYDRAWSDFDEALAWLAGRLGPGDVIATSSPHLAYLRTGARSVMPPMERDPAEARRLLDSVPVRYVIIDDLAFLDITRRYIAPAVRDAPGSWRRVHAIPGGRTEVYRRVE